jgi:hypothetical protein
MRHEDRKIRKATVKFCNLQAFNDPCAVTLTMKQRVESMELDSIACSRNFNHFSNRLNKAILRNSFTRYGNRIPMIAVLEKSYSQRYHYHTMIDRPDHVTRDEFKEVVCDCWNRTLWGYRENDFQFDGSTAGWIDYITKLSTKETYSDYIDWQNFHVTVE